MSERLNLSREDIINQYPDLANYLSTHDVAQLMNGRRLMSPEEKIEMFGGIDQVGNNIRLAKQKRSERPYIVLLACEKEPMTGREIDRFARLATKGEYIFGVSLLYVTIRNLLNEGLIRRLEGITLITLFDEGSIIDTAGYLLTGGKAVRRRVELLEKEGNKGFGFIPSPQPI